MGWLRGQQTDFPGTWGEGGSSTLTHCRSQLHCIPTSTPEIKIFFSATPVQFLPSGGGGSSTLHNMSQIFSLSFCSSITGHLRESPITDFVFPAFPRGGAGIQVGDITKVKCTLINRILKIQRCFRACSRVFDLDFYHA